MKLTVHIKKSSGLLVLVLIFLLASCGKELDLESVRSGLNDDDTIHANTSVIYSELKLSVKEIEDQINLRLGTTLLEDKDYVDRNGIKMKMKIERTGKIKMQGGKDRMYIDLPLRINGRILINETFLGVRVRAEPGFTLNLSLLISSSIEFRENFDYSLNTKIEDIQWPNRPVIKAGPITLDLTDAIESVIYKSQPELSAELEKAAKKEMRMRQRVEKAIGKIRKNQYINTRDLSLWMYLQPESIFIGRKPAISNDTIKVNGGLMVKFGIYTENIDSSYLEASKLPLRISENDSEKNFDIEIALSIPYSKLDTLLTSKIPQLSGDKLPRNMTLSNIRTGKYNDEKLWFLADLEGKYTGKLFVSGQPQFDSISHSLELGKVKMDYFSGNWLTEFIFEFLATGLKAGAAKRLVFPLDPLFEKVQIAVEKVFRKAAKKGDIDLELQDLDYTISKINLRKDDLQLLIRIQGSSEMQYHFM